MRLLTLQEVSLSRDKQVTALCGSVSLECTIFSNITRMFSNYIKFWDALDGDDKKRAVLASIMNRDFFFGKKQLGRGDLFLLFMSASLTLCKNRRDRICRILGLLDDDTRVTLLHFGVLSSFWRDIPSCHRCHFASEDYRLSHLEAICPCLMIKNQKCLLGCYAWTSGKLSEV